MRIIDDVKLDFNDVLIIPKRSSLTSRKEVSLERTYKFKHANKELTCIGIIASNMDGVGTFEMAKQLAKFKMLTALHKHHSIERLVEFYKNNPDITKYVFYSTGISESDQQKLEKFIELYGSAPENICIDVANGYTETFIEFIKRYRKKFPTSVLLVGNVVTPEMTEELILSGADIVKCGIGSGAVCTTRLVAGVGYPQLSAVIETSDAAHGLNGFVCSDGGCTTPADVVKAFAGGADFVMLGSMLAGHDEGIENNDYIKNNSTVIFYGMSSSTAMEKHNGGVAEYRSSEGRTVEIPYKGKVEDTVKYILGGLRSACTYTGSLKLKELPKRTTFIKVNNTHNRLFENVTTKIT